MKKKIKDSIQISNKAIQQIKNILSKKNHLKMKLRIYIIGGGCSGFQYGFKLDTSINKNDFILEKSGIDVIIDMISFQYLIGGELDFIENLNGSKFIIKNPNAKNTCGCGLSFSI